MNLDKADFINFILDLYNRKIISNEEDWCISKKIFLEQQENYIRSKNIKPKKSNKNVEGELLVSIDQNNYKVKSTMVLHHWERKLHSFYLASKSGKNRAVSPFERADSNSTIDTLNEDVISNASYQLEYMGTKEQNLDKNFDINKLGCYICQLNFKGKNKYYDHIELHTEQSCFKVLDSFQKRMVPFVKIAYKVCKNSLLRFIVTLVVFDVNVEKIIVVYNDEMSEQKFDQLDNGRQFVFDTHVRVFELYMVQPIVVVLHKKDNMNSIIVEQHDFLCTKEDVLNRHKIGATATIINKFEKENLSQYITTDHPEHLKKEYLCRVYPEFANYCKNHLELTSGNMVLVWTLLLKILDGTWQWDVARRRAKVQKIGKHTYKLENSNTEIPLYSEVYLMLENEKLKKLKGFKFQLGLLLKNHLNSYHGQVQRRNNFHTIFTSCSRAINVKESYMVMFRPCRTLYRYTRRAVEMLNDMPKPLIERILFPTKALIRNKKRQLDFPIINKSVRYNNEQLMAIANILEGPQNDIPYILYGPPGTGKTATLVEAVLQLYFNRPDTKILITANSNFACDEIALGILKVLTVKSDQPQCGLMRIYARIIESHREVIDKILLEHSNLKTNHMYPDVTTLLQHRIIVCTPFVIGKLGIVNYGNDVNGGMSIKYTHVFIDEVATLSEPETLICITSAITEMTRLIIAGDPKLSGPIIKSELAKELGLGRTLMERLLSRDCYIASDKHNNIQTHLYFNYRSHPHIVILLNELFYKSDDLVMIPHVKESVKELANNWVNLKDQNYPILFHSVEGKEKTILRSFHNQLEVNVIINYVLQLLCYGINGKPIKQTDIGIITPYRMQYNLIKNQIYRAHWFDIDVGTVEGFQGLEKPIIIISLVRSQIEDQNKKTNGVNQKDRNQLGFLKDPKRINSMISRAKSLIIIIGNPNTLNLSTYYKYIIDECIKHGNYIP